MVKIAKNEILNLDISDLKNIPIIYSACIFSSTNNNHRKVDYKNIVANSVYTVSGILNNIPFRDSLKYLGLGIFKNIETSKLYLLFPIAKSDLELLPIFENEILINFKDDYSVYSYFSNHTHLDKLITIESKLKQNNLNNNLSKFAQVTKLPTSNYNLLDFFKETFLQKLSNFKFSFVANLPNINLKELKKELNLKFSKEELLTDPYLFDEYLDYHLVPIAITYSLDNNLKLDSNKNYFYSKLTNLNYAILSYDLLLVNYNENNSNKFVAFRI